MAYLQPTFTNATQIVPSLQSDPFISGLEMTINSATTLSVAPGAARAYGSSDIIQSPNTLTLDTTVVGAGGCFPLAAADVTPTDDTCFGLYIIGDSSGVGATVGGNAPKLIIATGNNFLPAGYNVWRRIGSVWISSTTNNMITMIQGGSGTERTYTFQIGVLAINGGASTSLAQANLSTGDLPCNPNFVSKVALQAAWTPQNVANILSFAPTGTATSLAPLRIKASVVSVQIMENVEMTPSVVSDATSIYYSTTNGGDSLDLYLGGFTESLGLQAL